MYRATASIFISSVLALALSACALGSKAKPDEPQPVTGPVLKVFKTEYDRVWRATQKAMGKYPIKTNNIETGVLETDVIRGERGFKPAHMVVKIQPGLRYQLIVKLVRGQTSGGVASTEVSVEKRQSLEKNFFAEGKRLPSDGLEEESLLYRIDRELTLEHALDKAYEKD